MKKSTPKKSPVKKQKDGLELIFRERKQQIWKHRHTRTGDKLYTNGELVQGALCALEKVGHGVGYTNEKHPWPKSWSSYFHETLRAKDDIGKLTVAGAFFMAENDRLDADTYLFEIQKIAKRIDALLFKKLKEA